MLTLYIADAERDAGMKNLSRKEALEILDDMKVKIEIPKAAVMQYKRNAALDMAIEALKYSEIPNSSNDCISRQAAIAVADYTDYRGLTVEDVKKVTDEVVKGLKRLPSAQPEIIRCGECKHLYVDGENVRFNVCELNHNKVQSDDWFCADAERKDDETE